MNPPGTYHFFGKVFFFDFFRFRMPVCTRKHFWWKKNEVLSIKNAEFLSNFSELLWCIFTYRKTIRKMPRTSSKAIFSDFSCVQKYETSLEICFLRNIRRILMKVLSAQSFYMNIATVIFRQLQLHSINLKNYYLLFLVECNNFHNTILSERYWTDDFAYITRTICH